MSQEALDALGPRIHDRFVFVRRTIPKLKDFDDEIVYELRLLPEWPLDDVGTVASVV